MSWAFATWAPPKSTTGRGDLGSAQVNNRAGLRPAQHTDVGGAHVHLGLDFDLSSLGGQRAGRSPARPTPKPRLTWAEPKSAPPNQVCPPSRKADEHYLVAQPSEAYKRVLLSNPTSGDRTASIVGEFGHLERASAWTHLIAALLVSVYSLLRPWILPMGSLTAQLSGCAIVSTGVTFAVSTVYHVYSTVPRASGFMRNLDVLSIYISMGFSSVADLSLVTENFKTASLQTVLDPIVAVLVLAVFFGVRRYFLPRSETEEFLFKDKCSMGLWRLQHADLEHAGLRSAGMGALTAGFIFMAPAAFFTLDSSVAIVWLTGSVIAMVILGSGLIFDNTYIIDRAYANGSKGWCVRCNSKRLGCVMSSHAWWHIFSFAGTVVLIAAREYSLDRHSDLG